jgi:hypothetical protein
MPACWTGAVSFTSCAESRKDRRSQAWRTFIRNHAITIAHSCSFNGYSWDRDLLSQIRSRSRAFTYHLSAFAVAPVTGPSCWAVWHTVHPLLVAVARPPVRFSRIATLTTKSKALARRFRPRPGLLTIDRIRDPPTGQELKRHADRSSMRSIGKCVSFTRSTRRHSTGSSTNCPHSQTAIAPHRIAAPDQLLIPYSERVSGRRCSRLTF